MDSYTTVTPSTCIVSGNQRYGNRKEPYGRSILLINPTHFLRTTSIIGAMIWFNVQRESILQRIRVFRSDLASWE